MQTTTTNRNMQQLGFTIVELLIVIVVIGILAAITIVAFNGVQQRANTASAQSTASSAIKKSEAYNAEIGNYPTRITDLTSAASTTTYQLTGVTNATSLSNTSSNSTIIFAPCGTGSPAALANITTSNVVGVQVTYRNYTGSGSDVVMNAGTTSGGTVLCRAA